MEIDSQFAKIALLWSALVWNIFWTLLIQASLTFAPAFRLGLNDCTYSAVLIAGWVATLLPLCWGLLLRTPAISNWHYVSVGLLVPIGCLEGFLSMFTLAFCCDGNGWNFG